MTQRQQQQRKGESYVWADNEAEFLMNITLTNARKRHVTTPLIHSGLGE